MFNFLKKWFGSAATAENKDHRGNPLQKGEKTVSARMKQAAASKHSVIRRAPIDMAQGD